MKYCVLQEGKRCEDCGACNRCDLDPNKICDNCCKCLETPDADYAAIPVMDVVLTKPEEYIDALEGAAGEEEALTGENIPYETIDPVLLSFWEDQLRAMEDEERSIKERPLGATLHGERKKKPRDI